MFRFEINLVFLRRIYAKIRRPPAPKWGSKSASNSRLNIKINLKNQVLKPPFGGRGSELKHVIEHIHSFYLPI